MSDPRVKTAAIDPVAAPMLAVAKMLQEALGPEWSRDLREERGGEVYFSRQYAGDKAVVWVDLASRTCGPVPSARSHDGADWMASMVVEAVQAAWATWAEHSLRHASHGLLCRLGQLASVNSADPREVVEVALDALPVETLADSLSERPGRFVVLEGGEGQPGWFFSPGEFASSAAAIPHAQRTARHQRDHAWIVELVASVNPGGEVHDERPTVACHSTQAPDWLDVLEWVRALPVEERTGAARRGEIWAHDAMRAAPAGSAEKRRWTKLRDYLDGLYDGLRTGGTREARHF